MHLVTFLAEREAAPLLFGQIMYEFFQSGGSDVANMKEIAGKIHTERGSGQFPNLIVTVVLPGVHITCSNKVFEHSFRNMDLRLFLLLLAGKDSWMTLVSGGKANNLRTSPAAGTRDNGCSKAT